jgi:hypothetical protein
VPTYSASHVVPEAGAASIALKRHDLERRKPERVLRGRVVNENGDAVARAVVEPHGVRRGEGSRFGALEELGIDPLSVTDDNGEFRLGVGQDGDALYLLVKAPLLAPARTAPLAAGPAVHKIALGAGVTITGRVVKDDRPLAGVGVGMVQTDRSAEQFVGDFTFGTDGSGRFSFTNIPPHQDFYIYGVMDDLKEYGSIPVRTLKTEAHGSTLDVGDLNVQRGYRLTGRVVLSDGKPVPAGTRVLASRDQAWDSQTASVAPDGRFAFTGLPPERFSLSGSIRGYHLSPKNASFDLLNPMRLLGTVRGDIDDLRCLWDPGQDFDRRGSDRGDPGGEWLRRRDLPLQGAPVEK